jgi:hypothetical protein
MGTVHNMIREAGLTSRSMIRTEARDAVAKLLQGRPRFSRPEIHLRLRPNDAIRGPGGRICSGISVTALVVVEKANGNFSMVDVTAYLSRMIAPERVPVDALPMVGSAHEWTMGAMALDSMPTDTTEAWSAAIHGVRGVILPAIVKALAADFPELRFRAVTHDDEVIEVAPEDTGETVDSVDVAFD